MLQPEIIRQLTLKAATVVALLQFSNALAALSWHNVKPMYLVSINPSPPGQLGAIGDSPIPGHPIILNLETPPLRDEQLAETGAPNAMDRIFGGNVAQPHSFPYQVGLLLQRPKGLYWCGGSIISAEFVLTAAHCVDMAMRALVFLGAHEIKNAKEPGQKRLTVSRKDFIIFPTWNHKRLKDDIALVRLPKVIQFTDKIQPIQLPKRSDEFRSFNNKLAIASGWGRYASGVHAISSVLRYVKLQIVNSDPCKQNYPLSFRATNICTSGRLAKSTCNGDSGGPLVLRRRQSKKTVLIGITSFGSIYGCDHGYPAAFTKVAAYLDWISDETGVEPAHSSTKSMRFYDMLDAYNKAKPTQLLGQWNAFKPTVPRISGPEHPDNAFHYFDY